MYEKSDSPSPPLLTQNDEIQRTWGRREGNIKAKYSKSNYCKLFQCTVSRILIYTE